MNDRTHAGAVTGMYYFSLACIILSSFFNFSYRFYPLLNADMAINILMTPDYSLPNDFYAWGQDRGGTFIPFLAHIVYKTIHISPVSAVSLVHYAILILGFFAACSLLKTRLSRLFLALLWFFPPHHFIDFVLFPLGTQFSLLFIAFYMYNWKRDSAGSLLNKGATENVLQPDLLIRHLCIALSCILMILGVWVSELGILMILIFATIEIWESFKNKKPLISKENRSGILHLASWILVGIAFILYAKSKATRIDVYADHPLSSPGEVLASLKIIMDSLSKVFAFSSENFIESIYAWMLITGLPVVLFLAFHGNKGWVKKTGTKWFFFFLLNGILTFLVVIFSHWAFLNEMGRRYFVLVYISFAFVILIIAESIKRSKRRLAVFVLFLVVLTGSVSSCYKFYFPHHKPPRVRILAQFQTLGDIGLIGEYWNAYLSASPDPVHIKATPHDKDYVRNFQLSQEVFKQPRIFIIKDMWLDSFPDTLHQFGRTLVRTGDSFYLGECWINQYVIVNP
jgi:hypothetical protein